MSDFKKIYEQKIKDIRNKTLNSKIHERLEIKAISNAHVDEIIKMIEEVIAPKKVFKNIRFRTGKLFSIMKAIADNTLLREQLFEITNLDQKHLDIYFDVCGNLPWYNVKNNMIDPGRPMDVQATREFITVIGSILGYIVEESDIADITQERWDMLYANEFERAKETMANNVINAEKIPEYGYSDE